MNRTVLALAALAMLACGSSSSTPSTDDGAAGDGADPGPPGNYPVIPASSPSLVIAENRLPGTSDWDLKLRSSQHQIEGYTFASTAVAGDSIPVAVSVNPGPASISWIVYRIGYYAGAGAREIQRGGPVTATSQPTCPMDSTTGLVACNWSPTFTIHTGADWVDGIYFIKLTRADGWEIWVPLVLRYTGAVPDVVMIVPTATSQAYNAFQGESLYDDQNHVTGSGRGWKVSYDRPYARDYGAMNFWRWDQYVARWLETTGESIGYVTDEDVDRDGSVLDGAKVVVISGHDEYWTGAVRTAVESAVANGTSLLLFGANAGYWQVRYEPSADGRARRIITCYKEDAPRRDPVGPNSPDLTVLFRHAPVSRPENGLFGVMFQEWNSFGFRMIVRNPDHWALAGTGLAEGDVLPLIGGYEVDATVSNAVSPDGIEILAEAPLLGLGGGMAVGQMVVREQDSTVIFAAGGIDFAAALDGPHADPRVQRIAGNVLARALGRNALTGQVSYAAPAPSGPFASNVTTVAGAAFQPGTVDGPPGAGRLDQPLGVAILPGGAIAILDRAERAVRRLDASGSLSTLAALPNASAHLAGIAADSAGNVYVSDAWSPSLVRIDPSGATSTFFTGLSVPGGLAVQGGALYVVETFAGNVRKIDLASRTSTIVGSGLYNPTGVAVAPNGTIYAIENGNQRVVTISGGKPVKLAGDRVGFCDGAVANARLLPHLGLGVLSDGAVVVSDSGNARVRVIRNGQVTTLVASIQSGAQDGRGDQAELVTPAGLAVDAAGRIYVADPAASTVRRIDP